MRNFQFRIIILSLLAITTLNHPYSIADALHLLPHKMQKQTGQYPSAYSQKPFAAFLTSVYFCTFIINIIYYGTANNRK
jgi:uncharacterized membrane protein